MSFVTSSCLCRTKLKRAPTPVQIVPRYGYSVHGVTHGLVLTLLTGLAVGTYLQCLYSSPGRVPKGWEPDAEQQGGTAVLQVKRRGGGRRFCKKCAAYKPPRAHHCRRCGCCVLRMDHHCAWVDSCIGHGNYRAFLLMCGYLAAACLHALGLLLSMDAHLVQVGGWWWVGGAGAGEQGRAVGRAAARQRCRLLTAPTCPAACDHCRWRWAGTTAASCWWRRAARRRQRRQAAPPAARGGRRARSGCTR